jgi:hypothetical protein
VLAGHSTGFQGGGCAQSYSGRGDGMSPTVRERDWLIPSAVMTAGLGLAALLLMPIAGYSHIPDYFSRFLNWLDFMFVGVVLLAIVHFVRLRRAGVEAPLSHLRQQLAARGAYLLAAVAGAMLAGIDMLFFMWIKPELTAVSPFWADKLLADIDHAIFRTDPWRLFQGLDLGWHAGAYSFLWAVAIMGTVVWLLAQKPSAERSASLISYFAIWSLFGTIGQLLLSSAGPIFYQRIGLGDRFADLAGNIPFVTQGVSSYLWNFHTTGTLGVGAGISAMPSLHIATAAWVVLAFRGQGSKLALPATLFAVYLWALSVALGWHYAVDGMVGAAGAALCRWACATWLGWRQAEANIGKMAAA